MADESAINVRSPRKAWQFLGGKAAELLTVFVGVYAAFLLNAYQLHEQERQRREQVLEWMNKTYSESGVEISRERDAIQRRAKDFTDQENAGKMPRLYAFDWVSDYDPADLTWLLQGGGFELLDVRTVHTLRDAEGTARLIVAHLRHDQQLSDSLVLPNIDADPAVFYDPGTRKLLRKYEWYRHFFTREVELYNQWAKQNDELLRQIHAEMRRNR